MGRKIESTRELAPILGVGKSKAAELAQEPWLALLRGPEGWDEDEVRRALEARATETTLDIHDDEEKVLEAGADPVAIARAGLASASRRFAERAPGSSASRLLEDLGEALKALRITEDAYLELAKRRGELIERDVAKAVVGAMARRFVLACQRLEVRAAGQVELWLADEKLRAMSVDERARVVRAFVAEQTKQARLEESAAAAAAEIEHMVAAEIADRKGG